MINNHGKLCEIIIRSNDVKSTYCPTEWLAFIIIPSVYQPWWRSWYIRRSANNFPYNRSFQWNLWPQVLFKSVSKFYLKDKRQFLKCNYITCKIQNRDTRAKVRHISLAKLQAWISISLSRFVALNWSKYRVGKVWVKPFFFFFFGGGGKMHQWLGHYHRGIWLYRWNY